MNNDIFKKVKITRFLGATGKGGSRSQIMASADSIQYVIKFKENPQGLKVLVNELVSNAIARKLELPCPEGIIAEIDKDLLNILNLDFQVSPGYHFGLKKIHNCYRQPPKNLINQVNNINVFPGIVLFDILTNNNNRNNQGNYIIQNAGQNNFDFYIIDHGHCFGNPNWDTSIINKIGTWNKNALQEMRNCIFGSNPFFEYINRIKSLSNEFLSRIVNNVPEEWGINTDERNALKSFLRGQRDKIDDIIYKYKNLFPNWN